jgi:hypothetical protein
MTTKTRNIILITTSTLAIFGIAYYIVSKQKQKEMERFYLKQLEGIKPVTNEADPEVVLDATIR